VSAITDRFNACNQLNMSLRPIAGNDAFAIFTGYAKDPSVGRFVTQRPHQGPPEREAGDSGIHFDS
jgi:hypothetical protein